MIKWVILREPKRLKDPAPLAGTSLISNSPQTTSPRILVFLNGSGSFSRLKLHQDDRLYHPTFSLNLMAVRRSNSPDDAEIARSALLFHHLRGPADCYRHSQGGATFLALPWAGL